MARAWNAGLNSLIVGLGTLRSSSVALFYSRAPLSIENPMRESQSKPRKII